MRTKIQYLSKRREKQTDQSGTESAEMRRKIISKKEDLRKRRRRKSNREKEPIIQHEKGHS